MSKHHKSKRLKSSLKAHGHRTHRRSGTRSKVRFAGDSGLDRALSRSTGELGHSRGY